MIIPIELNFTADKDSKSAFRTDKTIKSHDINSVEFHISIEGLDLTDNHTAKILSAFHSSKSQVNVECEIVEGKIIYKPDTNLISRHEHVTNYVYVYNANQSLDVREFIYTVDLSKIDETSLEVKEVYDQSYADLLADFEQALSDYKDSLPQADSVRADIDEILTQFSEDSQQAIGDLGEVSAMVEIAEASRVEKESERVQAETERKEAETLREDNYEQLIDTALIEADVVGKVDDKVTELTPQINNLTAQLAQTTTKTELESRLVTPQSMTVSANDSKNAAPFITFIDDDSYKQYYTTLAPLLESKGFRGVTAVITGDLGTSLKMTAEQLRELQERGHEIASHTHDHLPFGTLTPTQIEYQCTQSKEVLMSLGLTVNNIVYPFGQTGGNEGKYRVKKHYRTGITTQNGANNWQNRLLKDEFEIVRVEADTATLTHLKSVVDTCVTNKTWLIFMTHANTHNAERTAILNDLMDYIKTVGVKVGTVNEGLDVFGNSFSVGSKKYLKILGDGDIYSNAIGSVFKSRSEGYLIDQNTPISDFELGKITYSIFSANDAATFPQTNEGFLKTVAALPINLAYQEWTVSNNIYNRTFRRKWSGSWSAGSWGSWETNYKTLLTPATSFLAKESKTLSFDISDMGGYILDSTGVVANCRSNAIGYQYAYNPRLSSDKKLHLQINNLADTARNLPAMDWDIRLIRG